MKAILRPTSWKLVSQQFRQQQHAVPIRNVSYARAIEFGDIEKYKPPVEVNEKWDIHVGLCIERSPVIGAELKPLEKRYVEFLNAVELEASKISNHEKRHVDDKSLLEKIKRGEIDQGTVETAQDFEDVSTAEALKFMPNPRKTAADKANDVKSLQRALDAHLLLLVQQEVGQNNFQWLCPQLERNPDETLRDTVDRLLVTSFPNLKTQVLGNAPWGFYKYRFSKKVKKIKGSDDIAGAKIFFYKASYVSGDFTLPSTSSTKKAPVEKSSIMVKDFKWVTRSELKAQLLPDYYKCVSKFLVDED